MPRQSIDWLITDTHWFHDAIIELCGRPVDHRERMLKNLRHLVAPQDRVFNLGDVIFYHHDLLKGMLDSFPGKKILLMGNHDHKSPGWYSRNGFDFVADQIVIGDVLLSHKPQPVVAQGIRVNVHGHWHNTRHHDRPTWWKPDTHRNLSIEETGYKPVKLAQFAAEQREDPSPPGSPVATGQAGPG